MARPYDISAEEKQIGARLRKFRLSIGRSQVNFANRAGLDATLLASYELGRARLNYVAAWKILTAFKLNPEYLAIEGGRYFPPLPVVPSPEEVGAGPRTPFSHVYAKHLANKVADAVAEWTSKVPPEPLRIRVPDASPRGRLMIEAQMIRWLKRCILCVPDAHLEKLINEIYGRGTKKLRSFPEEPADPWEQRLNAMEQLRAETEGRRPPPVSPQSQAEHPEEIRKDMLTIITPQSDTRNMQSNLRALIKRLRRATEAHGKKADLAASLHVPMQRVSEWLSKSKPKRPGGETTLRLLNWVQQEEAKQKESPASATNTSGAKTQVRKSQHEKQTKVRTGQ